MSNLEPSAGNSLGSLPVTITGRYRVAETTATTAEAVVYLADDLANNRQVGLEVLRGEAAADPEFVAAVRAQASRLAKAACVHPALARVYECGVTDEGDVFVVFESVAGRSLRETLDERGAFDAQRALRIVIQVGEALEALHRNGVVHGELRPEAITVVKDEDGIEAIKLTGLALTSARRTAIGLLLRDESLAPYLAPEQISRAETTEAADVHALGLLLQELLTGRRPHGSGPRGRGAGIIPLAIGRIIAKALEPGPGRRYSNVSLMVNDMWSAENEAPKSPAPEAPAIQTLSEERRVPAGRRARSDVGMAAALIVGLILVGATAWVVNLDRLAREAPRDKEEPVAASPVAPPAPPGPSSVNAAAPPSASSAAVEPVQPAAPPAAQADAPAVRAPSGREPAPAPGVEAVRKPPVASERPPGGSGREAAPTARVDAAGKPPIASERPASANGREPVPAARVEVVAKPPVAVERDAQSAGSSLGAGARPRRAPETRGAEKAPARSDQRASDSADGSAAIDWLLKDRRPGN
jgi:protein kinase-like protein